MREWLDEIRARLEEEVEEEAESNERRKREEPIYCGDDTFASECMDAFTRMAASSDCEVVWKALERRCDRSARPRSAFEQGRLAAVIERANREMHGEERDLEPPYTLGSYCLSREQQRESGSSIFSQQSRYIGDMAYELITVVAEIRIEPVSQDTGAKRRAKLREIEQAAEKLSEAIAPLWSGTRKYAGQHDRTDEYALDQIDRWLRDLLMMRLVALDAESVAIAYGSARNVVRNPLALLDALVEDARVWAREKPELAKPNDPNAERLLFIRKLTAYFRESYGEPLRSCVLASASVFFDCSSLDESAIAKLAP